MIELALAGAWLGIPHEVGAWTYRFRRGEEAGVTRKGSGRPEEITSRLSTEAAALSQALEEIVRDWEGEEVVVRATSAGLEGLLARRGTGVPAGLRRWYARIEESAGRLSSVRILIATTKDLAVLEEGARELLPTRECGLPVARASSMGPFRRRPV